MPIGTIERVGRHANVDTLIDRARTTADVSDSRWSRLRKRANVGSPRDESVRLADREAHATMLTAPFRRSFAVLAAEVKKTAAICEKHAMFLALWLF